METYTRSFATAAEFQKFWKKAINWTIFDREYQTVVLYYNDGTTDTITRRDPGTTAASNMRFMIRKPWNQDDKAHRDFIRLANIDTKGGCNCVITFA